VDMCRPRVWASVIDGVGADREVCRERAKIRNESMLIVTDKASEELQKVLASDQAEGKGLILYYQGAG